MAKNNVIRGCGNCSAWKESSAFWTDDLRYGYCSDENRMKHCCSDSSYHDVVISEKFYCIFWHQEANDETYTAVKKG